MKPTSSFKLSTQAKRMMAASPTKEKSSIIKKMMIDAEISAAHQPKRERVKRDNTGE